MGESRFKPKVPISRAHPINHHARWLPPDTSVVANPTVWNWILEVETLPETPVETLPETQLLISVNSNTLLLLQNWVYSGT